MKEQKLIADFVPIRSEEDEGMIRDMNKKAKEESSDKERRYPLTTRTLKRMMSLRLIAESLSDAAYDLLSFIQKQIDDKELASPKQTDLGKDNLNPLIVNSLLKAIWLSMHHVIERKHWLFHSKWLLVLIIDCLSIVETGKVNHIVKIEIVKLVVEIESSGISVDELDKETGSSDGLQPKQADLSYVHVLNKPHLHEIHVVPSTHEADQCEGLSAPKRIALSARVVIEKFIC
nr:hypothetical protein [Tanacetum cinerariifolium]